MWLLLALGAAFLLVDLGVWDFWGVQWWTAVLLYFGLGKLAKSNCKACKKMKKRR